MLGELYWRTHVVQIIKNAFFLEDIFEMHSLYEVLFFKIIPFFHILLFPFVSSLARLLFPAVDDNLLKFLYDDNQRVEPEWYIPIIPMVLINGAEGIGTGWACKLPNYDAREIVNNVRRMLEGLDPHPMVSF
jgi:hypothetical protein